MKSKRKSPWPTKAVMTQIYEEGLWGGNDSDFYSGEGSHHPDIVKPYIDAISEFLASYKNTLTVCDLGCGDFNIGKQLLPFTSQYIAIDIVEDLIMRNKKLFKHEKLEFQCLDISEDKLPKADCYILRQVLQHLSNEEIKKIINRLQPNANLILTEHIPVGSFEANIDIIASQGNRLKYHSGVDLLRSPFNLIVRNTEVMDRVILGEKQGQILTTLFELGTDLAE